MKINEILENFVKECSQDLNLMSIVQFGSSTYSKNPNDIDLVFVSNNPVTPLKDVLRLLKIIKNFEKIYKEVVFDIGGRPRKRKGKYSITVVLLDKSKVNTKYNPHDLFFLKNLAETKHKKVLFGKDPFIKLNINLNNQHLYEILAVDIVNAIGRSLDDNKNKVEPFYFLFKTFLRVMLVNDYGDLERDQLLNKFKKKFKNRIELPKNSANILKKKLKNGDFIDILSFAKECIKYVEKKR